MRVLFLTDSLSDLDGVGRYTIRLVQALEKLDPSFEPEFLIARKHRPTSAQVPARWPVSVGLPPDYFFYMSRLRFWPSFVQGALHARLAARRADLVHAVKDYPHSCIALCAARLAKKPCVATAHGTYSVQPLLVPRHQRLARWTYRGLGAVIPVSRYTAKRLRELLGERDLAPAKVHVVQNAVDAEHYAAPRGIGARPWHGQLFTLGIGELKERKGHHLALAGWAQVAARHPRLHHYIVGKPSDEVYRAHIAEIAAKAGVADRVHFLGNVSEDEKVDLLQSALAFVHTPVTSREGGFEGFGIVYLEAAACGTPSIGTRDSGAEDAVAEGESGLLVEPEPAAVAAALEQLVGDEELRARLGATARRHALSSSWDHNARRVLEIYRSLLR